MKNKRRFLFLLLLFLLTGCTVNYNLEISEDLSLSENVEAIENTITMQTNTNLVGEDAVNYLYEMFAPSDLEFTSSKDDNNTTGISNRTFSSFKEYKETFSTDVFNEVNIKKENNIYTFTANQSNKLDDSGSESLIYDEININLTIPFKVTQNNADEVNGNVYTWNIRKNQSLKNIIVSFDKNTPITSSSIVIGDKVFNYKLIVSLIILGLFIIFLFIIFIISKNRKNNSV